METSDSGLATYMYSLLLPEVYVCSMYVQYLPGRVIKGNVSNLGNRIVSITQVEISCQPTLFQLASEIRKSMRRRKKGVYPYAILYIISHSGTSYIRLFTSVMRGRRYHLFWALLL